MTERQAQKIFDQYNPESKITRCPRGRAPVRELLDQYAKAATNLYGIISKAELAEIFNSQNTEQTTEDEIYSLLLRPVIKENWYCFYKNYIVHYWAMEDFDYAESWLQAQNFKPRYIPDKKKFLEYADPYYEDDNQDRYWLKVLKYTVKLWPESVFKFLFFSQMKELSMFTASLQEYTDLLEEFDLTFETEAQMQKFFDLLMEANNNTRIWANKGYTPLEMMNLSKKAHPKEDKLTPYVHERVKIGENDPCPCGSGKKYKKCCKIIEKSKTAQLSDSDCILFYETWYGLMGYINEKKRIIHNEIEPVYPNPVRDELMFRIREFLWDNPEWIDKYITSVKLPEVKIKLLNSWRLHHKKGTFILMEYTPEHALAVGAEGNKDRVYAIKGISRALSGAVQRELPLSFESVLLPFKDKIIYDGFVNIFQISYAEGAKKFLRETYDNALEAGIVSRLDQEKG